MIVLPCPGVTAWAAPRAIAVRSDEEHDRRRHVARLEEAGDVGPDPARHRGGGGREGRAGADAPAAPVADGGGPTREPGRPLRADLGSRSPGAASVGATASGNASGMHGAASDGPPGDALNEASVIASGIARRSAG